MLEIHFGIRKTEVEGFLILLNRLSIEEAEGINVGRLSVLDKPWCIDGLTSNNVVVTLETTKPMATLNFLAQMFEPFLVRSTDEDRKDVRLMLTDNTGTEYEEFRW